MKATDLMIGDWVLISVWGCNPFPSKVTSINYNSYQGEDFVDWIDTEYEEEIRMYAVQPIPLTPEILEKNAIISENTVCIKVDNVLFPICNIFWEDNTKTEINCLLLQNYVGQMIMPTIKYVHEFQHLLRILKIEKEIVL